MLYNEVHFNKIEISKNMCFSFIYLQKIFQLLLSCFLFMCKVKNQIISRSKNIILRLYKSFVESVLVFGL